MFRKLSPVLLFLAVFAFVDAAPVKAKKAQIIKGWGTVIDPDRDCKVTEDKGKVTITVPTTYHDLTYTDVSTKRNAPRILQDVKGDFRVQVKVRAFPLPQANTSSSGKDSLVSSGLLVWIDDKHFLRLERAAKGEMASPFIKATLFQDGGIAGSAFYVSEKLKGTRIKIPGCESSVRTVTPLSLSATMARNGGRSSRTR